MRLSVKLCLKRLTPKKKIVLVDELPPYMEINLDRLLQNFNCDFKWFKEIFELFIEKYPLQIEIMRTAISENDSEQLSKSAHSFKSSASLFAVSGMVELAIELEVMGKEDNLQEAKSALSKLESFISGFIAKVKDILQNESSCIRV